MVTLDLQFFMFCRQLKYVFRILNHLLRGSDELDGDEENETTSTAVSSTVRVFPKSKINNFSTSRHRFRDDAKVRIDRKLP